MSHQNILCAQCILHDTGMHGYCREDCYLLHVCRPVSSGSSADSSAVILTISGSCLVPDCVRRLSSDGHGRRCTAAPASVAWARRTGSVVVCLRCFLLSRCRPPRRIVLEPLPRPRGGDVQRKRCGDSVEAMPFSAIPCHSRSSWRWLSWAVWSRAWAVWSCALACTLVRSLDAGATAERVKHTPRER